MRLCKVEATEKGAHDNYVVDQGLDVIPDGWAVIPDDMSIPASFPFVNITVEGQIVTNIEAGIVPESAADPDPEPTELEQMRADIDYIAMQTGVEL